MKRVLPRLTKKYIFEHISQEDIMERFLGIPIEFDNLVLSPLREDDNPTCGFKYSAKGVLRFKDFAGYFWGDCFDVVGYRYELDSKDPVGFAKILEIVAKEFRLHKFAKTEFEMRARKVNAREKVTEGVKTFKVIPRDWMPIDDDFWIHIDTGYRNHKGIIPVYELYINQNRVYTFDFDDPAYAYFLGKGLWQVYFPNRKKWRFLTNGKTLLNLQGLTPALFCVITKSKKDAVYLNWFGIQSVAVPSEGEEPSKEHMDKLRTMFPYIFTLFDWDRTGQTLAISMRKKYNTTPLFFKNIPKVKDFYDHVKVHGVKKTRALIDETKSKFDFLNE